MTLTDDQLQVLAAEASEAARAAGELIRSSRPQHVSQKSGGLSPAASVVTEIDRAAEARVLEMLEPSMRRHDLALLTEEREDDGSRHRKAYFWCIDPLDGTLPYVEGKDGYAVSIALVSAAGVPELGVVYRPTTGVLYRAIRGLGARRDEVELRVGAPGSCLTVFADRSFEAHPSWAHVLAGLEAHAAERHLDGVEVRAAGGAVVNVCGVLQSAPACYFKLPKPNPGGGSLWDFAATACLAHEAGAIVTDMFGAALALNRAGSAFMNHRGVLYASDEALAAALRQLC